MVVNIQRLRGKIIEKENTQESVADAMGMNRTTFYRKMKNGGNGFTIGDIRLIKKIERYKKAANKLPQKLGVYFKVSGTLTGGLSLKKRNVILQPYEMECPSLRPPP